MRSIRSVTLSFAACGALYSDHVLALGGEVMIFGVLVLAALLGGVAGVVGGLRKWAFGWVFLWSMGGLIVCGFVLSVVSLLQEPPVGELSILVYGPIMTLVLGILPGLLVAALTFLASARIHKKWERKSDGSGPAP